MRIPQNQFLVSQNFNSKQIEFCWHFPRTSGFKDQMICQIQLNPMIFIECGVTNPLGNYVGEPEILKVGYGHIGPEAFLTTEEYWSQKKFPSIYSGYFDNGKLLLPLVEDVVEYLQKR
jgi:hypothetical protein